MGDLDGGGNVTTFDLEVGVLARQAIPRARRNRLGPATIVAALIHLQIVVLVGVLAYFHVPRNDELASAIDITTLSDEASREIAAELDRQAEAEAQQEEEEKKKEEEKPKPDRQVVDIPTPNDVAPNEARYAAEHDSSTDRETHKRGTPEPPARPSQPQQPSLLAMRAPSPPRQAPGARGAPGAMEPPISGQDPETESLPPPGMQAAPGAPQQSPRPQQPSVALVPSQQVLARALSGGTSDHLPDVEEGDDTALNAKKWKFASFFNRVKEQIRQNWHAAREYGKRDPTGSLYGGRLRYTVLIVQLKPDGSLADVQLEKGSGIDFLDDVAVDAVKDAQPFPNPPQQLIDPQLGKISFRFGFVVDLEGETRLKVFRYSSM